MERFNNVFSPLAVKGLVLKNRLVMAPMGTGYGTEQGVATARNVDHYVARAKGGVGLIVQEATAIRADGHGKACTLSIYDDGVIPGLQDLVGAVHEAGAKIVVQLHHAGQRARREAIGCQPIGPSAVGCPGFPDIPRALGIPEIRELEDAYAAGAARALRAGYDAVEVHAAHGYLINQFLSPLSNLRDDEYGGDLERRLRFLLNIIGKVRGVVGRDYPIFCRISADERLPGGLTLADHQVIVPRLIAASVDVIDVSAGSRSCDYYLCPPAAMPHGLFLHLAAGIKQVSTVPVIGVGRILDLEMAEETIRSGKADLVAMGRALLADPDLPNKAREGRFDDIRPCIGCQQACRVLPLGCLANPMVGRDRELQLVPAAQPKKVFVVGGGPAGLEAARVAAERGHRVVLVEQEDTLGGHLRAGAVAPGKAEIGGLIGYQERQLRKLGVELRLGATATVDEIARSRAGAVVVATGGLPIVPDLPGIARRQVVQAEDVLLRHAPAGERVVVMGAGMTGCEVAEHLAGQGKQVTIVTRIARLEDVASDVPESPRFLLMQRIRELGVSILTGTTLEQVGERDVTVSHGGERATLDADAVVLAQGYRPRNALAGEVQARSIPCHVIGDAAECRTAKEAIREAAELARQL